MDAINRNQREPEQDHEAHLQNRAAGARGDEAAARPAAQRAMTLLRAWLAAEPRGIGPRLGMAGVRARCELPFADLMGKGRLIGPRHRPILANGPADFAEEAVGAIAEPFLSGR